MSPVMRRELEIELSYWKTQQATNRVDVRFGNKAAKSELQYANAKVKELQARLEQGE